MRFINKITAVNMLALCVCLDIFSGDTCAQTSAPPSVRAEEFVFTNFSIEQKMGRMLADINSHLSAGESIEAQDATEYATLTTLVDSDSQSPGEIIEVDRWNNLCQKMKEVRREILREESSVESEREASLLNSYIRRCAPNGIFTAVKTPNDANYGKLWGMNQTNDIDIDAPEAWDVFTGSKQVVIAVIDSGVQYDHPDLSANMWVNPGETAANGIDDDGNGYIDDIYGVNTINGSGNPIDDNNHGTHCAGTIGAKGNNGSGVVGVNWDVSIMGIKFLGSNGSGSLYDAVESIDYATNMKLRGVNIVATSNSWGCAGCYYAPMYDAIQRAKNAGILFIAAAGNSSNNNDTSAFYPAGFTNDNVITVAAVDANGNLASFSNYGATSVDIGAPGVGILSTVIGSGYSYFSGTSMATPHVAGAIALLSGYAPQLSWLQLKTVLLQSAVPYAALSGKTATGGMLNIKNLLSAAVAPTPAPTATPAPTNTPTITPTPTRTPTPTNTPTPTPTPVPGNRMVSGVVLDSNGTPIVGVKIDLSADSAPGTIRTVYADASGSFSIPNVWAPTNYSITAFKAGYGINSYSGYLTGDTSVNLIAIASPYALSAQVIKRDKSALSGVSVTLSSPTLGLIGNAITDSNGKALFSVPAGIQYALEPQHPDYTFNSDRLYGESSGPTDRVFVAIPR